MREAASGASSGWPFPWRFAAYIYHVKGAASGISFVTGYVIEYSLSVDNLFLFLMIFTYFQIRAEHQHRVLLWGIIGALVMRGAMIAVGVQIVARFEWVLYGFGVFLVLTGVQMFRERREKKRRARPSSSGSAGNGCG